MISRERFHREFDNGPDRRGGADRPGCGVCRAPPPERLRPRTGGNPPRPWSSSATSTVATRARSGSASSPCWPGARRNGNGSATSSRPTGQGGAESAADPPPRSPTPGGRPRRVRGGAHARAGGTGQTSRRARPGRRRGAGSRPRGGVPAVDPREDGGGTSSGVEVPNAAGRQRRWSSVTGTTPTDCPDSMSR